MRARTHTEAKGQTDDREAIPVCQPVLEGNTETKFCDYKRTTKALSFSVNYDIYSISSMKFRTTITTMLMPTTSISNTQAASFVCTIVLSQEH